MSVLSTPKEAVVTDRPSRVAAPRNRVRTQSAPKSNFWQTAVFAALRKLAKGQLAIVDRGERHTFGNPDGAPTATVEVLDPRFYRRAVFGGGMGVAEAYRRGEWRTDDLVGIVRLFARNRAALDSIGGIVNRMIRGGQRFAHWWNRNSKTGSRRNIAAHYDLSNEFFSTFLDDTMTYSSGVFPSPNSSLRTASIEKYDRICRKLDLSPRDHVLEIGTGWGGFATFAAQEYGCRVTTTTISDQQHRYARDRIQAAHLSGQVTLLKQDYRDLTGTFDKLVSIEMIEAVGDAYLKTYFEQCSRLLRPEGSFLLQAITIPDQRYDRYRKSVDFIQKYIFPGGCLPSIGSITNAVGSATDMRLVHLEDFGEHYARTLAEWRSRFHDHVAELKATGHNDSFLRTWDYYLAYCEGGFRECQIGVSQILFQKPECRQASPLALQGSS